MKKLLFIVLGLVACAGVQAQQLCWTAIRATTPTAEFTFHGDGTVTHQRTGLMWKQCLEGQAGAGCGEETATLFNWSAALQHARSISFAGHGDWRLPNIRELASIVEERCANPAFNLEVFPANPAALRLWSSSPQKSPFADAEVGNAWIVDSFQGQSVAVASSFGIEYGVRLVRGGHEFESVNAPGGVSDGLRVWLRAGSGISVGDGEDVLAWPDLSGNGNFAMFNPANAFGELPPVFDAANPGANGQPTLRFNNHNALELDLSWLAGSDYTIFVVNARDRLGNANFYIAGETVTADSNLILGYETPSLLRHSHFARDLDTTVEEYTGTPIWSLDVFLFDARIGKVLFRNGVLENANFQTQPLISNAGSTLGHFRAFGDAFWYQGDLAEVIVYTRALNAEERLAVESALSILYGLQ